MSMQALVENELVPDASSSVCVLKDHRGFGYSDGVGSEKYLERVLRRTKDLGSRSSELQSSIRDWTSEYHLSRKRAQLLAGFTFDRSLKVLEVGCGCGAIARYLGESFDDVVSVEGNINRARLARLRTRDLDNVSILCAPFQSIRFRRKFDVIICVGVYEYSASFVDDADPYEAVLRYFSSLLTPTGVVVLAIENQFGLKYFGSSREDHLGAMFEGVEGYHAHPGAVRTFGRTELESNLRKHFPTVRFYYPYPDYKLPDCVIADEFLASGRAGELVSQLKSRDHSGATRPLFDESLASLELARNGALPFFSNSFLVLAGKGDLTGISFDQLAVVFSADRREQLATKTRIVKRDDGGISVLKRTINGPGPVEAGVLKLTGTESPWNDSHSLQTIVYSRCSSRDAALEWIFEPCRQWVVLLRRLSATHEGEAYLGGEHIDSIWPNVYPGASGYEIVDREWIWAKEIPLNVVVIRAIYNFLARIGGTRRLARALDVRSGRALMREIAKAIGVRLDDADFERFVALEAALQAAVFGIEETRHKVYLRWFLFDRWSLNAFGRARNAASRALSIVPRVIDRMPRGPEA